MRTPGNYREIAEKYNISSLAAIAARNRGVELSQFDSFFHITKENLHSPEKLKDAEYLTDILAGKISEKKSIRVVGDYDIDGVFATFILFDAIKKLGGMVSYAIPHRVRDGYGLNERLVREAIADGVDTIITCDNGIAAVDEIALAKENGLTVLVTDHHEVRTTEDENGNIRYILPPADVFVDIKREDETYPFPDICGAVIAWKIVLLLEKKLGADIGAEDYIDMAGFATIGDVMELKGENRTIASLGLLALRNTKNLGLRALIEVCEVDRNDIKCHHVGFRLGPAINATGRLDSADTAESLLLAETEEEAGAIALKLYEMNKERQRLTEEAVERCIAKIGDEPGDAVIISYLPDVHESVCGIIAGRLRERYYRPSIVFADSGELVKGSARSIPGYDMFSHLNDCGYLFEKFGGHPMAAGMSLKKENLERLREFLNQNHGLDEEALTEKIKIDAVVPFDRLDEDSVRSLDILEPFGNGNERPVFAVKAARVLSYSLMGREQNHMRLTVSDSTGVSLNAVFFSQGRALKEYLDKKEEKFIDFLYFPQVNVYNGNVSVQMRIIDYR